METNLITFLTLIGCHYLADFPFQGDWLSNGKGKSFHLMFIHCMIYASTFIIFAHVSPIVALILFMSHILIDISKACKNWITFNQDQVFHLIIICLVFAIFYLK